jgi:NAD(P)-dependent dehydrogenase (short-subunit alcohol dehydrogenase family)
MNDKVVLVTGGAGNLGRAVTTAFLEAGARVAVPFYKTDSPSALEDVSREHGSRLHSFALDLTTERGAEQAVRTVVEWGGGLDSVVHLIGGFSGGATLAETPLELWTRMVDLNMTSAYLVARFAIPRLLDRGGGTLVFVSARAVFEIRSGRAAYAATKAGLITLAQSIGEEYGPRNIRSNVIVPDTIDTEDNRRAQPDADRSKWISPDSIARVILFLASPASKVVNGAALPVYGAG